MGPRILPAIVCGAAAGLLGRYMLIATLGAYGDLLGDGFNVDLAAGFAPLAVGALVAVICVIAPNGIGAWFRGCLMVTAIAGMVAMTALQCIGFGYVFGEIFDDPMVRDEVMAGCPEELSPALGFMALGAAAAFGIAAILVWRVASRDVTQEY